MQYTHRRRVLTRSLPIRGQQEEGKKKLPEGCNMNRKREGEMFKKAEEEKLFHMQKDLQECNNTASHAFDRIFPTLICRAHTTCI